MGFFTLSNTPNKYAAKPIDSNSQIPKKISRFRIPQCPTKSALDRNLNAKPNSKNPKNTFTVIIQPPDFGKPLNRPGNKANKAKGKANASPKPNMPTVKLVATSPPAKVVLPRRPPKIGPVHEKETRAKVSAIKKTPTTPSILEAEASILLLHEAGRFNS